MGGQFWIYEDQRGRASCPLTCVCAFEIYPQFVFISVSHVEGFELNTKKCVPFSKGSGDVWMFDMLPRRCKQTSLCCRSVRSEGHQISLLPRMTTGSPVERNCCQHVHLYGVKQKKGAFKSRLVSLEGQNTSINASTLSLIRVLWQTASVLHCHHSQRDNCYLHPRRSRSMRAAHPSVSAAVQAPVQFSPSVWCKSSTVHI